MSVRNVRCFGHVKSGLDIKTGPSRGGPGVHGVRFENVLVGNAKAISGYHTGSGISIDAAYGSCDKSCQDRGPFPAIIDNVTFVNITQVLHFHSKGITHRQACSSTQKSSKTIARGENAM